MKNLRRGLIAPSLLSADFSRLAEEIADVEKAGAEVLHIDVMDGHFVPNLTIGAPVLRCLKTTMIKDCHLMVKQPENRIQEFAEAGADIITIHLEACKEPAQLIRSIREKNCRPGLAINPDCPVERLRPFLAELDLVLIMSVFAGFGGQKFIPESVERVKAVAEMGGKQRKFWIEVDGGLNPDNVSSLRDAGADIFVAGSSIFGKSDRKDAIEKIRNQIRS